MRCTKCGSDNPENVEFCAKCGGRLHEARPGGGTMRAERAVSRSTLIAVAAAIAIMLGPVLVYVYLSPDYSWSDSIRDADGDGFADTMDVFPDDPAEWSDGDSDGVGDNGDIMDYGNAVVWISVDLFIGDGTVDLGDDQDGTAGDPYFVIQACLIEYLEPIWEEPVASEVFNDTEKIIEPFSVMIDIPENQGHFNFRVYVYDDDGDTSDVIDLGGIYPYVEHHFVEPFSKSFVRDSSSDGLGVPGCLLVYSIALGNEEYGEP
jgi:hypothetical protein